MALIFPFFSVGVGYASAQDVTQQSGSQNGQPVPVKQVIEPPVTTILTETNTYISDDDDYLHRGVRPVPPAQYVPLGNKVTTL